MSFVYVLTNEWFPGLIKLGATKNIKKEFDELQDVLPGKSTLNWFTEVENCFDVASKIREILAKFSVSRQWFCCPSNFAIDQVKIYISNHTPLDNLFVSNKKKIESLVDLGSYCKSWRGKIGMNQLDFADNCGVSAEFISEFESGKETCQFDDCIKVATMLGIDFFAIKR
jgi:DNA-binding XRE family transcriptional regulator